MIASRRIAQRFERNRELRDPSSIEPSHFALPHGVPVGVVGALVECERVEERAERRDAEQEAVAAVVERVERNGEVVVVPEVRAVAAHFVQDHSLGVAIPATARDVQVVIVEQHPRLGPFTRRRALLWFGLNEVCERLGLAIRLLVQLAVDLDRRRDPRGADGDVPRGVA